MVLAIRREGAARTGGRCRGVAESKAPNSCRPSQLLPKPARRPPGFGGWSPGRPGEGVGREGTPWSWGRGSGTRTGQGLTREQPERAPRDQEEGQHVRPRGRPGPAQLPGPQPRSSAVQQSPRRRRVFLAPALLRSAPSPRRRPSAERAPRRSPRLPARSPRVRGAELAAQPNCRRAGEGGRGAGLRAPPRPCPQRQGPAFWGNRPEGSAWATGAGAWGGRTSPPTGARTAPRGAWRLWPGRIGGWGLRGGGVAVTCPRKHACL